MNKNTSAKRSNRKNTERAERVALLRGYLGDLKKEIAYRQSTNNFNLIMGGDK